MDIQKKSSLTENEIQQMKDLAYICGQHDQIDYSTDLHTDFLMNRNENQTNDFNVYNETQLIGVLSMYDFERPTKLELIGFVHPHFRKQQIGTNLLQTAMKEISKREVDEVLLIINGNSTSGKSFANQMKLPYLYSEYGMEFKSKEIKKTTKNNIQLSLASSTALLELIEISSKAFGDSVENTATWLHKMLNSSSHQVFYAHIDGKTFGTITVNQQKDFATLSGFAVHPSYQGKGYGKEILNDIVYILLAKGISTIELEVETKNSNALKLYTQCGFEITKKHDYYDLLHKK
ncbi:hypothetical protein ICY_02728 [Bacillus cereus BAG2X1-3]|nr:hypothetical protein ICY_02728 [Bacillus cereus BAG2X1-3]